MEEGLFRLEALVNLQQEYQQCVPSVPTICMSHSMWQTCSRPAYVLSVACGHVGGGAASAGGIAVAWWRA